LIYSISLGARPSATGKQHSLAIVVMAVAWPVGYYGTAALCIARDEWFKPAKGTPA
jgi:hypothetical protein